MEIKWLKQGRPTLFAAVVLLAFICVIAKELLPLGKDLSLVVNAILIVLGIALGMTFMLNPLRELREERERLEQLRQSS